MGKHHFNAAIRHTTPPRCLGCKRPVIYGDRCPPCQQELRKRRRRKPR